MKKSEWKWWSENESGWGSLSMTKKMEGQKGLLHWSGANLEKLGMKVRQCEAKNYEHGWNVSKGESLGWQGSLKEDEWISSLGRGQKGEKSWNQYWVWGENSFGQDWGWQWDGTSNSNSKGLTKEKKVWSNSMKKEIGEKSKGSKSK